jgi:hypothetical protein
MEKVNKELIRRIKGAAAMRGHPQAKIQYSRRQDSRRWRYCSTNYQRLRSSGNAMTMSLEANPAMLKATDAGQDSKSRSDYDAPDLRKPGEVNQKKN